MLSDTETTDDDNTSALSMFRVVVLPVQIFMGIDRTHRFR